MRIRSAREADARSLAALAGELGYPVSEAGMAERLAELAGGEEHVVLVAEVEGEVVGWLHCARSLRLTSRGGAEIVGFVVTEASRGRGVGRALLVAGEEWASSRGCDRLRVRTRTGRADARAFYQRVGFRPSKEQVVFDKPLRS